MGTIAIKGYYKCRCGLAINCAEYRARRARTSYAGKDERDQCKIDPLARHVFMWHASETGLSSIGGKQS